LPGNPRPTNNFFTFFFTKKKKKKKIPGFLLWALPQIKWSDSSVRLEIPDQQIKLYLALHPT